jgi:hypothetical protein
VKHVTKYIQPGLELISLDPKRSISIIGADAFENQETEREVALRLATDIGAFNQEGCVNARVIYVLSGTDASGLSKLNRLAALTYLAMMGLPPEISTKPKEMDAELRSLLNVTRLSDEWFHVIGGKDDEGAIIASQVPEAVEFAPLLSKRIANLVPIDNIEEVFAAVNAYTQTVGVYPEHLKHSLKDRMALHGAQRFTSLGYAADAALAGPQDGIETIRQMCKWIICEDCDPQITPPLWKKEALCERG